MPGRNIHVWTQPKPSARAKIESTPVFFNTHVTAPANAWSLRHRSCPNLLERTLQCSELIRATCVHCGFCLWRDYGGGCPSINLDRKISFGARVEFVLAQTETVGFQMVSLCTWYVYKWYHQFWPCNVENEEMVASQGPR